MSCGRVPSSGASVPVELGCTMLMVMVMVVVVIMVGTVGWRVMATAAVANGLLCAETVISPALAPMLPGPPAVPRGQSGQHERPRPLTPVYTAPCSARTVTRRREAQFSRMPFLSSRILSVAWYHELLFLLFKTKGKVFPLALFIQLNRLFKKFPDAQRRRKPEPRAQRPQRREVRPAPGLG